MADVLPNPNSGAAGTEWQTTEALRRKGQTVDTVWADELTHYIQHGNLHYLLELPLAYRTILLKKFSFSHYDVVHVNQPHGYLAAKMLGEMYKSSIFVHRSHGFEARVGFELRKWYDKFPNDSRPTWKKWLSGGLGMLLSTNTKMIAKYADGHIVSASECGDFLHQQLSVPLERIAVIPQAPLRKYQETPALPMSPERLRRLLYVGQFAFIKAPMILAEAVERVLSAVPQATFTWVCDERHHADAMNLFQKPEILQRVIFQGWLDQNNLQCIYDEHGLFLFPSFFEGFGKAFIEAMSRRLVVVAARNGGMKDVIEDGKSGVLVPTGDAKKMAEACINLIHQPEVASRIAGAARQTALDYTWDRVADETLGFYQRLLHAKRSTAPVS